MKIKNPIIILNQATPFSKAKPAAKKAHFQKEENNNIPHDQEITTLKVIKTFPFPGKKTVFCMESEEYPQTHFYYYTTGNTQIGKNLNNSIINNSNFSAKLSNIGFSGSNKNIFEYNVMNKNLMYYSNKDIYFGNYWQSLEMQTHVLKSNENGIKSYICKISSFQEGEIDYSILMKNAIPMSDF